MAEERVVLQVKFEEAIGRHVAARAAGDTASSLVRANRERVGGLGRSSTVPVAAEIVSDFKKETRQRAGDLFDRLKDQKERIAAAKATATATRATSIAAGGAAGGLARAGGALLLGAAGGPLGVAAALTVVALTAAGTAAFTFSRQLKKATDSAKELSGAVIRAAAIGEREVLFARRRQARELGPDLARSVRARSQADVALTELQTAFLRVFLPAVLPFLESASDAIVLFSKFVNRITDSNVLGVNRVIEVAAKSAVDALIKETVPGGHAIVAVKNMLAAWTRKQDVTESDEFERGLDEFLDPDNWDAATGRFAR